MSNSDHPYLGKVFQEAVRDWFVKEYGSGFQLEVGIPIGVNNDEKKPHMFDIVNTDLKMVIECKRYTWTETGNVPSAKIRALNEAAFFIFVDYFFSLRHEQAISITSIDFCIKKGKIANVILYTFVFVYILACMFG